MSGGRSANKKVIELWLSATYAATKFFKIGISGDPAGLETKWILPAAIPAVSNILEVDTVSGTTINWKYSAKPTGGGSTPSVVSLSSAAGSVQLFKGASGTQFSSIEFYDLLVLNSLSAPQKTALGNNAMLIQTGIDTLDILINERLQAIAAAGTPTQTQIPQLGTNGNLSFVNRDTFASATGTTSTTFVLDSGVTPVMLKDVAGNLTIRNGADNANADITVQNLTVTGNVTLSGTGTLVTGDTVALGDNILRLNADLPVANAPTENAGLEIQRGSSGVTPLLIWDETTDEVFITQGGSLKRVSIDETFTFTATTNTASVVYSAGILTVNHNKNRQYFKFALADNNGKSVDAECTYVSANQATWDLTGFGTLTGTWTLVI